MANLIHGFATTYSQLKTRVAAIQSAKGISQQQIMNYASALNGWMKRLRLTGDSLVGDEMTSSFDIHFLRHQDHLVEKLSQRTARDQAEHLLTWRRHFEECRQIDTLPADFKGAFNALFVASGMTKAELSRESGVSATSIHNWLDLAALPVGKLMLNMLAAVAEMERDLLVERTQSGLARAKAEGKTLGRPTKTTESQRAEIIDMRSQGTSVSALSRTYGVSRASIMRVTGDL